MDKFIVYKHTNKKNNKSYIGITSQEAKKRWQNGNKYKNNKYFWNAIKKYGWDNFDHEIIFEDVSKNDALKKEEELIAVNKSSEKDYGYNLTLGGELNIPNKETLKKLSESHKGKHHNGTFKKGMIPKTKGTKRPKEVIEKMKATKKKNIKNGSIIYITRKIIKMDIYGNTTLFNNARDAARSVNLSNGSHILEACKGIRSNPKGYFWKFEDSDFLCKIIKATNKKDNSILYFPSTEVAAKYLKLVNGSSIRSCLRNNTKSAAGYTWEKNKR